MEPFTSMTLSIIKGQMKAEVYANDIPQSKTIAVLQPKIISLGHFHHRAGLYVIPLCYSNFFRED